MSRRPFSPLAFDELPETPRVPHGYFESADRELTLDSRPFGRHRVSYREMGSGPPLLLVHGLMTTSYSFRYVMKPLAERYRLIVPDLVGAGRSDKPDVSYDPQAMATWISELVRALDLEGCLAIGNSLGGYLCMRAVVSHPQLFSRLVNLHSPGLPEPRLRALAAALAVPGAQRALAAFARRKPERWVHKNVHYFDETLKSREEARQYGEPLATREGSWAFARYMADTLSASAMGNFVRELSRRRDRGEPFPVPLLLVYSRQDPMVPPRIGAQLAQLIPSAELVWLEDSSHFAHVDSPERFLDVVLPFLSSPQS
ncbi:MAG: alpha/beta hydrolase [Myxococcales bacterium]|nr:alpha/beta hydrolase [Myxococcales bacterium]